MKRSFPEPRQRFFAIARLNDRVAVGFERVGQKGPQSLFVVDNQNSRPHEPILSRSDAAGAPDSRAMRNPHPALRNPHSAARQGQAKESAPFGMIAGRQSPTV